MEVEKSLESLFDRVNPFASKFREVSAYQAEIERQVEKNKVGFSSEYSEETNFAPDGSPNYMNSNPNAFAFSSNRFSMDLPTDSKRQKILFYRTMAYYPEIKNALDIMADEAIVMDANRRVANLKINRDIPTDINRLFHKEFDYVMNGVFRANEGELKNLFKKFLVDAELFVEYIKGDRDSDGIIGYQLLPSYRTYPIYGNDGQVQGFVHKSARGIDGNSDETDVVPFEKNQVGYASWEKGAVYNVRGYLETARRPYNQLLHLEDSVVVYRLVRAPERRLWNIEMGQVSNTKAEEYLNAIMNKYQRTLYYNPSDGRIDAQKTIQSMSEDYWFVKKQGQGSDVQVLQSGMNLGEINDINYILGKLYKSLSLPVTRWDPQLIGSNYQSGKQIEREELKFSYFVDDAKRKFEPILKEAFINHIVFKYKDRPNIAKWVKKRNIFNIDMIQSNYFREYKEMEKMTDRLNLMTMAKDLTIDINNPESKNNPLSRKWIMTNPAILGMTEEDYIANSEMRQQEIAEMEKNEMLGNPMGSGGSDEGGFGSGGMGSVGGAPPPDMGSAPGAEPGTEAPAEEAPAPEAEEPPPGEEALTASYKPSFNRALKFIMEDSPTLY